MRILQRKNFRPLVKKEDIVEQIEFNFYLMIESTMFPKIVRS